MKKGCGNDREDSESELLAGSSSCKKELDSCSQESMDGVVVFHEGHAASRSSQASWMFLLVLLMVACSLDAEAAFLRIASLGLVMVQGILWAASSYTKMVRFPLVVQIGVDGVSGNGLRNLLWMDFSGPFFFRWDELRVILYRESSTGVTPTKLGTVYLVPKKKRVVFFHLMVPERDRLLQVRRLQESLQTRGRTELLMIEDTGH